MISKETYFILITRSRMSCVLIKRLKWVDDVLITVCTENNTNIFSQEFVCSRYIHHKYIFKFQTIRGNKVISDFSYFPKLVTLFFSQIVDIVKMLRAVNS